MPSYEFHWPGSGDRPSQLETLGPVIWVEIGIPAALEQAKIEAGQSPHAPISGYALIDTGASASAVDESVFHELGVPPLDSIPTSSPHGNGNSYVYPAQIAFPTLSIQPLAMERLVGCNLRYDDGSSGDAPWTAEDGNKVVMLLGRDLLSAMLLVYNGSSSRITICI